MIANYKRIFYQDSGILIMEESTMKNKKKEKIETDPFGSYTGRPKDVYEKPVQDADDL